MTDTLLSDYAAWMRDRRLAPAKRIPFFVRWVDRFLACQARTPQVSWRDGLPSFLEKLEREGAEDWQIRQAGDAVTLCFAQFRPSPSGTGISSPGDTDESAACEQEDVLGEMRGLMRIKRYSPRTVRSYMSWAGRSVRYVRGGWRNASIQR